MQGSEPPCTLGIPQGSARIGQWGRHASRQGGRAAGKQYLCLTYLCITAGQAHATYTGAAEGVATALAHHSVLQETGQTRG